MISKESKTKKLYCKSMRREGGRERESYDYSFNRRLRDRITQLDSENTALTKANIER